MSKKSHIKRSSIRADTDVRRSDRTGIIYADTGREGRKRLGVVPICASGEAINTLDSMPDGTFIAEERGDGSIQLFLSAPTSSGFSTLVPIGGSSFNNGAIGLPADGSYTDGAVNLDPNASVAENLDKINEFLLGCGCATLASHLGTQDGNTDGRLLTPNYINARISTPDSAGSPFFTNNWDDDTDRPVTNALNINWNLLAGESITDLQGGVIEARFFNGDNTLLHTETLIPDGTVNDQSSSPSGYVEINNLVPFLSVIQGRLELNIDAFNQLSGNSGYLRVEVDHTISSSTYSETTEFFRDSVGGPMITTQNISYSGGPTKFLSGVQYATISGINTPVFQLDAEATGVWSHTYRTDPLRVLAQDIGIPVFTVQYNASTVTKDGISPPVAPFEYTDDFVYSENRPVTLNGVTNPDANGNFAEINYEIRDPFNSSLATAQTVNTLINTQAAQSTDVLEIFADEDYRLLPNSGTSSLGSISGSGRGPLAWDSTDSLAVVSGLQVINGALIYPQSDFSVLTPTGNPDYSSLPSVLGDEVYVRRFRDTLGVARSNGVIRIEGLTEADRSAENILIELRVVEDHIAGNPIPGPGNLGTGWLSLNKNYNSATFTGDDGDGCFVTTTSQVAPNFEFTLGNFSTGFSSNQAVELRVTYKNPVALNRRITRIEFINWNS